MALDTPGLKAEIKSIMADMRQRTEVSDDEFADRLATAFETFVKTSTIIYQTGLTAPNGPVTGAFEGSIE